MLCPLCQKEVGNEESLQLHYLSCSAYIAMESANQGDDTVLAKFRWIKAKPCFEEQVYLISSLAGSVPLKWSEDEGLYESELTSLPLGEHICQLAVAGDVIPTEDVLVNKDSDAIYIIIKEDPQSQYSTMPGLLTDYLIPSAVGAEDDGTEPLGLTSTSTDDILGDITGADHSVSPRADSGHVGELSPLYQELLRHQVEHGEPSWVPSGGARDLDSPSDFARQLDRDSPMSDVSDTEMTWSTRPEAAGASNELGQQSSEASIEDGPSPSPSSSNSRHSSTAASPVPSPSGTSPVALVDIPPELDTRTQTPSRSVNDEDDQAVFPLAPGPSGVTAVSRETVDGESATSSPTGSPRGPRSVTSDHDTASATKRSFPSQTHSLPSSPGTVSPRGSRSVTSGHDVTKRSSPEPVHSRPRTPGSLELANIDGAFVTSAVNEHSVIHSTQKPGSSSTHSERSVSPLHRRVLAESAQKNGHHSSATSSPVHSLILSEPDRRRSSSDHNPDESRTSSVASPRTGSEASHCDPRPDASRTSSVPSPRTGSDAGHRNPRPDASRTSSVASPRTGSEAGHRDPRPDASRTSSLESPRTGSEASHHDPRPDASRTSSVASLRTGLEASHHDPGPDASRTSSVASPRTGSEASHHDPRPDASRTSSVASPRTGLEASHRDPRPDASRTSSVASPRTGLEASHRDPRPGRSPASSVHSCSSWRRRTSQQGEENSRVASPGSTDGASQRSFGFRSPPAAPPSSVLTGSGRSSPSHSPVSSPRSHSETDTSPREPLAAPPTVVSIPSEGSAFQSMDSEHRSYEARPSEAGALRQERDELARKLNQTAAYYEASLTQLRKKNEDLEQQLLSVQTAAGLDHEELEGVKELERVVAELKEALGEREAEVQRLEESNRRIEEEQESLKTVSKIQMDDLKEFNTHLESKLKRLEKESHGRSSRELRELNQLQDQVGRLERERSELLQQLSSATREIGTLKLDKMVIEGRLTRAKSATDLSFNRIFTHDNSRSTHRSADGTRRGAGTYSGSYSSQYSMANGHYNPGSYRESSSGNIKWLNDEQLTRKEAFSTTTSHHPVQSGLDSYRKRHLTSAPVRRRFGSLDDDSDLSDVADVGLHTRHDEPVHRRTDGEYRIRSHRPHSYHGSSSFMDYSKHDTHHRSATHSPPDSYSTFSSPYTSDSSTIIAASHKTASRPSQTVLTKPFAPSSSEDIQLGMRVLVTRTRGKIGRGVVRYVGDLPGRTDTYLGVELDTNDGKHDGSFDGRRFFKCQGQKGIFVSFNKVVMCYG